jgi:hypothetical protein
MVLGATQVGWSLSMDDVAVSHWLGSGSKEALLVLDWQQPQTIVLGYRWDGTATGEDVIEAAQAAGIGFARTWHPSFPGAIFGMGYDVDGDGGAFVAGTPGLSTETGYASDADDYYAEGWYVNGYWAYYVSQDGQNWGYSADGVAHALTDGSWEGWSWAPAASGWDGGVPNNIPLMPEPATAGLMVLAGMLLSGRKRLARRD